MFYTINFFLNLYFSGMSWYGQVVQQCSSPTNPGIDETLMCGRKYTMQQQTQLKVDIESNNQRGDQSFSLDVAHYLRRTLRFRIPTVQPQEVINFYLSRILSYFLLIFFLYLFIFFFRISVRTNMVLITRNTRCTSIEIVKNN